MPIRINTVRITIRHIIVKLLKTKHKDKNLEATWEKWNVVYGNNSLNDGGHLVRNNGGKRQWYIIFKSTERGWQLVWWRSGQVHSLCFGGPGFAGSDPSCGSTHHSSSHAVGASHILKRRLAQVIAQGWSSSHTKKCSLFMLGLFHHCYFLLSLSFIVLGFSDCTQYMLSSFAYWLIAISVSFVLTALEIWSHNKEYRVVQRTLNL